MDAYTAVKKMMLSIKIEESIPEQYYPFLRTYLRQMYVVGWEEGRTQAYNSRKKVVAQYNVDGKLVNSFKGLEEASKKTRFPIASIRSAINRGTYTHQGFLWKYLPASPIIKEGVSNQNSLYP